MSNQPITVMEKSNVLNQLKEIKVDAKLPKVKEYKLMYQWGAWVTHARFCAENDEEAIHDAEEEANKLVEKWKYGVALFCGNRLVKKYKEPDLGRMIENF